MPIMNWNLSSRYNMGWKTRIRRHSIIYRAKTCCWSMYDRWCINKSLNLCLRYQWNDERKKLPMIHIYIMIMIDNSRNLVPSVTPGRPTQRAIFHHKPYKTCSDHKLVYFLVIKPTIDRYPTMALIRSKNWPEVPPVRPSPVRTLATSRQRSSITGRLKV